MLPFLYVYVIDFHAPMPHNQSMNLFISGFMFLVAAFFLLPLIVLAGMVMWSIAGIWAFPIFVVVGIYAVGLFMEEMDKLKK